MLTQPFFLLYSKKLFAVAFFDLLFALPCLAIRTFAGFREACFEKQRKFEDERKAKVKVSN
jgi:hypothetical protein